MVLGMDRYSRLERACVCVYVCVCVCVHVCVYVCVLKKDCHVIRISCSLFMCISCGDQCIFTHTHTPLHLQLPVVVEHEVPQLLESFKLIQPDYKLVQYRMLCVHVQSKK